jgi:hypothetical protein
VLIWNGLADFFDGREISEFTIEPAGSLFGETGGAMIRAIGPANK